jgi:hypothetical protein
MNNATVTVDAPPATAPALSPDQWTEPRAVADIP